MTAPDSTRKLTIIGLGLIGGSLGLAVRAAVGAGVQVVGHSRTRESANKAKKIGAIDRVEHNLPRAVEGAGIVVVCTPVLTIREVFQQIAPHLADGAIVTDVGSTKEKVMDWAAELLPPSVSFIGGHPMAGKETQGIDNAEAGLFRGKPYILCPAVEAREDAVKALVGLVQLIGADPVFLEPKEHDQYAAAVSHLPLVLSVALFTMARASPAWEDIAPLASSGFRDVTRLASGDPQMSHDIFLTNREAALHWLGRAQEELDRYRQLIEGDPERLLETLARAKVDRDEFLAQPRPKREGEEAANVREELMSALMGGWIADRVKKARELPGLMKDGVPRPADGEPTRAQRIAEDIRRDLEKLEDKRKAKD
jgi:prephenate dehydrogenase